MCSFTPEQIVKILNQQSAVNFEMYNGTSFGYILTAIEHIDKNNLPKEEYSNILELLEKLLTWLEKNNPIYFDVKDGLKEIIKNFVLKHKV